MRYVYLVIVVLGPELVIIIVLKMVVRRIVVGIAARREVALRKVALKKVALRIAASGINVRMVHVRWIAALRINVLLKVLLRMAPLVLVRVRLVLFPRFEGLRHGSRRQHC